MDAALIILDGWGLGDHDRRDAIKAADTPNFDRYRDAGAFGTLIVDGRRVGLPDGQMGNSEVGHLNIGAGRVVKQAYTRIGDSIDDGSFYENDAITAAYDHADEHDGRVHLMGLVSDGGVHSDQQHLHALIELAADRGVEAVTHAFTDGRDTSPTGGEEYLSDLEAVADEQGTGGVATVSGRYYAMDRDQNWERTKRAYDAIVEREAEWTAETAVDAVTESYDRGDTDEFVEPTVVDDAPALEDGDSVVFFNFRADRARQLVGMLCDIEPVWEFETTPPELLMTTMTQYDKTFDVSVAYPPEQPEDTLGEVLAGADMTQLRMAESEKYPHVTYFLNGGREVEFDGEIRNIVESPDVPTYDLQPEMSAVELTDTAIDIIESDDPNVMVLNYANPDMVGHTGDYGAAIEAVEAVDEQLGRLVERVRARGGHVCITADHGNADDMGTEDDPHTAHTFNPVPFVYLAADRDDEAAAENDAEAEQDEVDPDHPLSGGRTVREGGSLCDIAPTILELVGVDQPSAMTGESLLD
ncbi:2,3-bisphosphoglycerate-independent phosphoglycerate mutase [Haloferax volcanii]|uniref:2,3-bisphosphoglycerate-independent phosphoglycerate mutase n=3 Tax=Haloferax volcanii TaxID=2246 RepID=A0A384KXZ0_HALVD|nr:2,3-bisphosphoglycerate-independent phosphoglycerate mutase [Haloferax volcanii]ADE04145.1 phosphoglycerate mutase, 2,3-biphosphateglycerate-independent type [Haloferax volcanii DS2]ELY32663.1 phosphoglyceromutase [Haloferax volcanii DS2]MBS8118279.1 2,3-bisphosphoglycerate-independent phosphoglycerate mutase [Haloferax volcanii]MBS8123291.1 2,3-bisphosphoglycerate-independent phosphoglycerate mutase [Haloferax volcanii]MBS8127159.1 2,3-bisphosphoglycerate-independent phosphoglycerate mutas